MVEQEKLAEVRNYRFDTSKETISPIGANPGQIDRDLILNSHALRRLAGITQVAAAVEGHLVHNRLTHVLKVAQIARRIAEKLIRDDPEKALQHGGIDPDVVEAAALAHDLGHPPFGHLGEVVLNKRTQDNSCSDGFEGNAQSFRIVTKLAIGTTSLQGLGLSRATLNALLKYPWLSKETKSRKTHKFGAYHSEEDIFKKVREPFKGDTRRSVEAEIMDWADDIAYSVHDMEDFYRCGKIPLDRLRGRSRYHDERKFFFKSVEDRWILEGIGKDLDAHKQAFDELTTEFPATPFFGSEFQRWILRNMVTMLTSVFINGISLSSHPNDVSEPHIIIDHECQKRVAMLKELTWTYVINDESLRVQKWGQRKMMESLCEILLEGVDSDGGWGIFPHGYSSRLEQAQETTEAKRRFVADFVCDLTEHQVTNLYHRLTGVTFSSAFSRVL